jgi:hypothetical protein
VSKPKHAYRRPGTRVAIGLPGQPPSRQARQLAAAPLRLPVGCWHVSDHAVDKLSRVQPMISTALHVPSCAHFRLASLPDGPILAIEAISVASEKVLSAGRGADPTAWANRQQWRIVPPARPHATFEDGWIAFDGVPDLGADDDEGGTL